MWLRMPSIRQTPATTPDEDTIWIAETFSAYKRMRLNADNDAKELEVPGV